METPLAVQAILVVLAADFVSGFGHFVEDSYGLPSWPLIGKLIIEPNIDHHRNPTLMVTMWSFIESNRQLAVVVAVGLTVAWLTDYLTWPVAVCLVLIGFSNETHAWAHGARRWWLPKLLQDMALVITPYQHAKHHHPPYQHTFCTITNLLNPLLDRLRFWRGLEWLIGLTGVHPKRMSPERGGY